VEFRKGALEGVVINRSFWRGRDVLITGHTGFKGGWLSIWLEMMGARIHGYALAPPTQPSLFDVAAVSRVLATDARGDLADSARFSDALRAVAPEIVFHLAAQPLVRESYDRPVETFRTNVLGTVHVLESCRHVNSVRAVVVVTTDKVYQNREWVHPYREMDRLGGADPYSASKAAAELVTESYRASFFAGVNGAARVASARAGNVIGGGDWGKDRLLPDCIRAFCDGKPVALRYPGAVRPWQHVLEPLSGYLVLAERLATGSDTAAPSAWNFGPDGTDDAAVADVARMAAAEWSDDASFIETPSGDALPEMGLLRIDSSRARAQLGWRSRWTVRQAVAQTVAWHRAREGGADMLSYTRDQIGTYEAEFA
jgi:CDP-glucose 4,6-dehydratase